jgi:Asp-tRNA(Asn)/Glu-tRNA(Gln) amidotransferase B subunit
MNWEIVLGLEAHVQLKTQSKILSRVDGVWGGA